MSPAQKKRLLAKIKKSRSEVLAFRRSLGAKARGEWASWIRARLDKLTELERALL